MARSAGNIVLGMQGIYGLHVFGAGCVAGQAALVDFFCRVILEHENLGHVSAALDVSRTWTVATFASLVRRAAFRI